MKPPTLTKQQIARRIGQRTRLSNRITSEMLDALIEILSDQLAAGGRIEIANFLTLVVQTRTRLVNSGEERDNKRLFAPPVETFYVLKCRPGKSLRYRLRTLARRT
ncbi:MAG: HU family DNA-binding protein [Aggregatilineales bacterium]